MTNNVKPTGPFDPANPLARVRNETSQHNEALHDYIGLGPGRSLTRLLDFWTRRPSTEATPWTPPTEHLRTLKGWSTKYQWQARIEAYEAIQHTEQRRIWEDRRRQWRDQTWSLAQDVQGVVAEVMSEQAPRLIRSSRREVRQPDGTIREIVTVGLDANAVARLIDAMLKASEAALESNRQAAGTEEDPIHTVGLSLEEWRSQQEQRRTAALETLAEFGPG